MPGSETVILELVNLTTATNHNGGPYTGCAITGGVFYTPAASQSSTLSSPRYYFADSCGGWINVFNEDSGRAETFASGIDAPVDLQLAADGSLYYLARGSGSIYRVTYTGP